MPAKLEHDCFRQPPNPRSRVWRYMDLAKFVSLLTTRAMFFTRADKLGDNFEGSLTSATIAAIATVSEQIISEAEDKSFPNGTPEQQIRNAFKQFPKENFVSCWHLNDHESAAMWRLYSLLNQGLAIQTTYEKLAAALPEEIFLGGVIYADYENVVIPFNNTLWPVMHKRMSFRHENEVRVVFPSFGKTPNSDRINEVDYGVQVTVDLNELVESVLVHPESPKWFLEVVASLVNRYGMKADVQRSRLSEAPIL